MTKEELLKEAIRRFRVIADDARQITLGNISHSTPKRIERYAANSYELLETHICDAALDAMDWKEQQLIDKAMKVICDGCAQKAECEFNNWKTCSKKDELIKLIGE